MSCLIGYALRKRKSIAIALRKQTVIACRIYLVFLHLLMQEFVYSIVLC